LHLVEQFDLPPKVAPPLARSGDAPNVIAEQHVFMSEKMTTDEFFALFGRTSEDSRWAGSADSEEYLTVVTYLAQRAGR
jgi:hypothetical protein